MAYEAINYAEKNGNFLDQKLTQGMFTNVLETPSVNWLDARTFRVREIITSGLQPHTRNKGFNPGTLANPQDVYTLEFDRDIEFYVDKADVDETNRELAASNVSRTFIQTQAQPEIDAYRFSKLAQTAVQRGKGKTQTIDASNAFDIIKDTIRPMRTKYGPGNILVWVSSEAMDALENSDKFTRVITNQNLGGPYNYETRISSFDGVRLQEIWDEGRFASKFDFTDGFTLTDDGKQIDILAVATPAVIAKTKINSIYLHAPGSVGQGDGYLYQYRHYHDLWVLKKHEDAVSVSLRA